MVRDQEGRDREGRQGLSLGMDATYRQYEDKDFVRAFFELRGTTPRAYEKKLLLQLVEEVDKRRAALGLGPGDQLKLLDLGTGYGRDLAWLDQQPGFFALGVDYSATMLSFAKQRLPGLRQLLAQMDLRCLGVQDRAFDVVRAQAVFHHLGPADADLAMGEVARVLKPGGLLGIFVRYGSFDGFLEEPGLEPRYFHYYVSEELTSLLNCHGLEALEEERIVPPDPRGLTFLAILAAAGKE